VKNRSSAIWVREYAEPTKTPQLIIPEVLRFRELHPDAELQNVRLAASIAAHFYPESDAEDDRKLAIMLFAKLVPSFSLRLHAAIANASEM
jgi:hypothetical protein